MYPLIPERCNCGNLILYSILWNHTWNTAWFPFNLSMQIGDKSWSRHFVRSLYFSRLELVEMSSISWPCKRVDVNSGQHLTPASVKYTLFLSQFDVIKILNLCKLNNDSRIIYVNAYLKLLSSLAVIYCCIIRLFYL